MTTTYEKLREKGVRPDADVVALCNIIDNMQKQIEDLQNQISNLKEDLQNQISNLKYDIHE